MCSLKLYYKHFEGYVEEKTTFVLSKHESLGRRVADQTPPSPSVDTAFGNYQNVAPTPPQAAPWPRS